MRKLELRVLTLTGALAGALLSTACFTPANFGAGIEGEHAEGEPAEGEHAEGEHAEGGEAIVEGIKPGSEGKTLEIKAPEIPYEAPFDGKALSSKTLDSGVVVEEFLLGDGVAVADGTLVEFSFKGYGGATGNQVMGSRAGPVKLVINDELREKDPIAKSMAEGLAGMKTGGKRRVKVPASIVEENAPPGRQAVGDLWLTIELVSVAEAPELAKAEAFTGTPVASKKRPDGLEIIDFVAGEGRTAKAGDQVTAHYIGQLLDGTEFDSSHSRADGMPVIVGGAGVIKGFSDGMEGARPGMLRKLVIPPELGYGERSQGKIPSNSTLVFLLQIMDVSDGPPPGPPGGATSMAGRPPPGRPTGAPPAGGDKPKPAPKPKPVPKPAEGGE